MCSSQCVLIVQICRRHKNSEATAYLLEKAGDIQGAFGIILTVTSFFFVYMYIKFPSVTEKKNLDVGYCCVHLLKTWSIGKNILLHVLYLRMIQR